MNTLKNNPLISQAKENWEKEQEHKNVMKLLDSVRGYEDSYTQINGNYYFWAVSQLTEEQVNHILDRNVSEEILTMIHRYGQTTCPDGTKRYLNDASRRAEFSEAVQNRILSRNRYDEIYAYISYYPLTSSGLKIIFDFGNHEMIMDYITRYPLEDEYQYRLLERDDKREIETYHANHGWCPDIINSLLDNLKETGDTSEFYTSISKHEFPVPSQIYMLDILSSQEFKAYIERYGLWNEVHQDLILKRSEDDICSYIMRHRFLDRIGERELAKSTYDKAKMAYVDHRYYQTSFSFLTELLSTEPLYYEAIIKLLIQKEKNYHGHVCEEDVKLMREGTHEEVMARLKQDPVWDVRTQLMLFFRGDEEEIKTYVANNRKLF